MKRLFVCEPACGMQCVVGAVGTDTSHTGISLNLCESNRKHADMSANEFPAQLLWQTNEKVALSNDRLCFFHPCHAHTSPCQGLVLYVELFNVFMKQSRLSSQKFGHTCFFFILTTFYPVDTEDISYMKICGIMWRKKKKVHYLNM